MADSLGAHKLVGGDFSGRGYSPDRGLISPPSSLIRRLAVTGFLGDGNTITHFDTTLGKVTAVDL